MQYWYRDRNIIPVIVLIYGKALVVTVWIFIRPHTIRVYTFSTINEEFIGGSVVAGVCAHPIALNALQAASSWMPSPTRPSPYFFEFSLLPIQYNSNKFALWQLVAFVDVFVCVCTVCDCISVSTWVCVCVWENVCQPTFFSFLLIACG